MLSVPRKFDGVDTTHGIADSPGSASLLGYEVCADHLGRVFPCLLWACGRFRTGYVGTRRGIPANHVHTALEAAVELALSPSTGQDLGLDDELVMALPELELDVQRHASKDAPKFFATSKASSGVFAAILFGVGIPYYCTGLVHGKRMVVIVTELSSFTDWYS